MKKIVSLILALCMLICAFAAVAEGEYPIVSEPITVTALVVDASTELRDDYTRLLWDDLAELTGVKVEFTNIDNDTLPVWLAAGDWTDFIHKVLDSTYINDYGVTGGMFYDWNELLEYMPNLQKLYEDDPTCRRVVTETNGAVYQLPRYSDGSTATTARFHYRRDIMNNLGLEEPKTIDDLYNVLTAIKESTGEAPMVCPMDYGVEFLLYSAFGTSTEPDFEDDGNGKVIFNRTGEQYKLYLQYVNKLYEEGLLHKEFMTLDRAALVALVSSGSAVFTSNIMNNVGPDAFPSGKCEIGTVPPLTSEYDDTMTVHGWDYESISGFAMNADTEHAVEIAKLLDISYALEEVAPGTGLYGEAFCWGPENVTWRYTNDEKSAYEYILPEGISAWSTFQYGDVMFANCGRYYSMNCAVTSDEGNSRERQLGYVSNLMPYQVANFPGSFLKFNDDEQSVLDNNWVDIESYVSEMRGKFITGAADIDADWDGYCATIESMGMADVLDAYQAAYDRWLAM